MIKKFVWGGANDKKVNIDYNHTRTLTVVKARLNYARLAKALASEGKNEKLLKCLIFVMQALPPEKIPYDPYYPDLVDAFFLSGAAEPDHRLAPAEYGAETFFWLDWAHL
jgi:hypothetical protein